MIFLVRPYILKTKGETAAYRAFFKEYNLCFNMRETAQTTGFLIPFKIYPNMYPSPMTLYIEFLMP